MRERLLSAAGPGVKVRFAGVDELPGSLPGNSQMISRLRVNKRPQGQASPTRFKRLCMAFKQLARKTAMGWTRMAEKQF